MSAQARSSDTAPGRRESGDQPGAGRLLALSDGVVAIALTLLVLQLKVPGLGRMANPDSAAELAGQLGADFSQMVSYLIAYYVIAHFWLVHFRVFRRVYGHRESLAWWNFAFLFTITLMPFTSSLMGSFSNNPLAVDIFAVNLLLASLATQAADLFGRRGGALGPEPDPRLARAARARAIAVVIVVGLSISVAWLNTDAAKYCWALLPLAQWGINRAMPPDQRTFRPTPQ